MSRDDSVGLTLCQAGTGTTGTSLILTVLTSLAMLAVLSGCFVGRYDPEKEHLRALAEINEDLKVQSDFLDLLRIQRLLTAKLKALPFVRDAKAALRWETMGSYFDGDEKPRMSAEGYLSWTAIVETEPGRKVSDTEISRSVELSLKKCGLRELRVSMPIEGKGRWILDGRAVAPGRATAATAPEPERKPG